MEYQALFSSKDKSKKLKCRLLQCLFGTLRVNIAEIVLHCICWYSFKLSHHSLTLKVPIITAADDIYKHLFIVFQRK